MRFRRLAPAVALAIALVPAGALAQQSGDDQPAPPDDRTIAAGVSAAGVDVGGLTLAQAAERLHHDLDHSLARDVVVRVAGRTYRLHPTGAGLALDAEKTAKRAYYAGRDSGGSQDGGGGTAPQVEVPLAVTFRKSVTHGFARAVAASSGRSARNARVKVTVRHIFRARARAGRALDATALARTVDEAFGDPRLTRKLAPRLRSVPAAVNANDLRRQYRTVVTVSFSELKLRLFKNLKLARTYGVAIGRAGFDTPKGLFRIQSRIVDPPWHAPNEPWAGSYAGRTVPGGAPDNPLKARWLGVSGSVGIHGTAEEWSIGSRASHGCIRMRVRDVIALYPRVPLGTPVLLR